MIFFTSVRMSQSIRPWRIIARGVRANTNSRLVEPRTPMGQKICDKTFERFVSLSAGHAVLEVYQHPTPLLMHVSYFPVVIASRPGGEVSTPSHITHVDYLTWLYIDTLL